MLKASIAWTNSWLSAVNILISKIILALLSPSLSLSLLSPTRLYLSQSPPLWITAVQIDSRSKLNVPGAERQTVSQTTLLLAFNVKMVSKAYSRRETHNNEKNNETTVLYLSVKRGMNRIFCCQMLWCDLFDLSINSLQVVVRLENICG